MKTTKELKEKYAKMLTRLERYSSLDRSQLSKEMAQFSSLMFTVGVIKSDAENLMDNAKRNLEVIKARVDKEIRINSKKKLTEKQVEQRITRHKEVCAAFAKYAEAKWKFNVCWAAVNSMSKKGDMLTNIAYNHRKELEYGHKKRVREENVKKKFN